MCVYVCVCVCVFVWLSRQGQLETGADNLPVSECPSSYSPECWDAAADVDTLAGADVMTFLYRERQAYALFQHAATLSEPNAMLRGPRSDVDTALASTAVADAMQTYLWNDTQARAVPVSRPVWGGLVRWWWCCHL